MDDRCEAYTVQYLPYKTERCASRQLYSINGKCLCDKHAKKEALHLAMKLGKAKALFRREIAPAVSTKPRGERNGR